MKFKIDENLPIEVAEVLLAGGHEADTIHAEHLNGTADSTIAAVCQREGRVLVTLDLDFANVINYPPVEYPGIVVLRPHWQDRDHVTDLVRRIIPLLSQEPIARRLWIVEEARVRIHPGEVG